MTLSRSCLAAALFLSVGLPMLQTAASKPANIPPNGFVPDEKTAIRVAEALLIPIFGEKRIDSERPFSAELNGDIWVVKGYLPYGVKGGVAEIQISKKTCQVISVTHGK